MISVQLVPARPDQITLLQNLWQLYSHDFTEYLRIDVDAEGRFPYDFEFSDYFEKTGHWPYIAMMGENIAGFVLFSDRVMGDRKKGRHMEEFFIMRRFRRKGIGRSMAFQAFDTFAGYWEVSEVMTNQPAIQFWRQVIGDYTGGKYQETTRKGTDVDVLIQMFDANG